MIRTLAIASLGLLAAGCVSAREEAENAIPNSLDRFPLVAEEQTDQTLLAVHPRGLSRTQAAAVAQMGARWREAGGRGVMVRAPQGAAQQADAYMMAEQVRGVLIDAGVAPDAIQIQAYDAGGDSGAPLIAEFGRYVASVPRCGGNWDNLTGTQSNGTHANFGCAVSANMAAQIANPADIVAPRTMDPADASRRSVVLDHYRKGETTATQTDPQGSGTVSQAVR